MGHILHGSARTTEAVRRAIQHDLNIYTIARNMGTSMQMIEQYYGQAATAQTRARKLGCESGINHGSRSETVPELTPEQKAARAAKQRERRAVQKVLTGKTKRVGR
jgi:hypothetical protein